MRFRICYCEHMLTRIRPLLPSVPALAWIVLGWTILAHMSTAEFLVRLVASISGWLGQNAWAGFALGLGLLAMAVWWPDLRPWLAKVIRLHKTSEERLSAIESEHIPRITKTIDAAYEAVLSHTALIASTGGSVETCKSRIEALEKQAQMIQSFIGDNPPCNLLQLCLLVDLNRERADNLSNTLNDRLAKVESSLEAYGNALVGARYDLSELEKSAWVTCDTLKKTLDATRSSMEVASENAARILLKIEEVSGLISEYGTSLHYLEQIVIRHPQTAPAQQPFSKRWSDLPESPDVPLLAIEWATFQIRLVAHCKETEARSQHRVGDSLGMLSRYLTWDSPERMDVCKRDILSQQQALYSQRAAYAATLASLLASRDAIS